MSACAVVLVCVCDNNVGLGLIDSAPTSPVLLEVLLNTSSDLKVSVSKVTTALGEVVGYTLVLDPKGTTWGLVQMGKGHFTGSSEACPSVGKLVVHLWAPGEREHPVVAALLASEVVVVDFESRTVQCGHGLVDLPCDHIASLWRPGAVPGASSDSFLVRFPEAAAKGTGVTHLRVGVLLAHTRQLSSAQKALVEGVRPVRLVLAVSMSSPSPPHHFCDVWIHVTLVRCVS
jgi:hypothetical protein